LATTTDWYNEIILPAFREFKRRKRLESDFANASAFAMSTMFEGLPSPSESSTPSTEYIENPNGFYEDDRSELGDSTESDDE